MHLFGIEIPLYAYIIVVLLVWWGLYHFLCWKLLFMWYCVGSVSVCCFSLLCCVYSHFYFIRLVTFAFQPHKSQNIQRLFMRMPKLLIQVVHTTNLWHSFPMSHIKTLHVHRFFVWFFPCLFPLPSIIIQIRQGINTNIQSCDWSIQA